MYGRLGERLGIKDHSTVLNLIVNKVASNLRLYGGCDDIIQATLTMFQVWAVVAAEVCISAGLLLTARPPQDLAGGFMSGKLMLKLDAVRFMLANHTQVQLCKAAPSEASRRPLSMLHAGSL